MAFVLHLEKKEETADDCEYSFGSGQETAGRVRLEKASGNIEILEVAETDDGPSKQFYLAHLVPRLQGYHDRGRYPPHDRLSV